MSDLASSYDAALFDLDGVIYLGPQVIEGVPDAVAALRQEGIRVGFVTNNAARTPATVAEHLVELGIEAREEDVVNSTQATLRLMADELEPGTRVLVLGTDALVEQLRDGGFTPVGSLEDDPQAVVQGYNPQTPWSLLEEGVVAIHRGAAWYATNPDMTRPTERGILPGCGAQVAVVQSCVDVEPRMAGKPYLPLLHETVDRLGAKRPIFVGDRLDTDILGANRVDMDSLFVFTGAHGKNDLLAADEDHRPTYIGQDIGALLVEPRVVDAQDPLRCRGARVEVRDGAAVLVEAGDDLEGQLDALWALLQAAWHHGANATEAVAGLSGIR